jgi:NADH-ubiquinone oxidoreductase chain 5
MGTLSAFFTAFYSFRLIYLTFFGVTNGLRKVVNLSHESSFLIITPLFILSIGSLFSGFMAKDLFVGVGSTFLGNSIFTLPKHFNLFEAEFLPPTIKVVPLIFSLSGAFLALLLNNFYKEILVNLKTVGLGLFFYSFFNQKWFFDKVYNIYILKPSFHFSFLIPFRLLDKGFIELFGPLGLILNLNYISKKISKFQTGLIYHYTFIILLGLILYINMCDFGL